VYVFTLTSVVAVSHLPHACVCAGVRTGVGGVAGEGAIRVGQLLPVSGACPWACPVEGVRGVALHGRQLQSAPPTCTGSSKL